MENARSIEFSELLDLLMSAFTLQELSTDARVPDLGTKIENVGRVKGSATRHLIKSGKGHGNCRSLLSSCSRYIKGWNRCLSCI